MIENNSNEEVLVNNEVLKEDDLNTVVVENKLNENDSTTIETLSDNTIFTPVVSDGIFEEELLILDENNNNDNNQIIDEDELSVNIDTDKLDNNENIIEPVINNVDEMIEVNNNDNINEDITVNDNIDSIDSIDSIDNNLNNSSNENIMDIEDNKNIINDDVLESKENIDLKESDEISNDENIINEDEIKVKESNGKEDTLLEKYGENFSVKEYVCNPAIGRDNEIKQLILTLLTPEKSGILVGKPGIGKTAIVEGLGYQIQQGNVPDALKEYQIYKLNTSSLLGLMPGTNEPKIQVLLNEIKGQTKLILFIDEIHTLIGAGAEGDDSLDFANIFKPGLDRGNIKIIGATTSDEYDQYILTDKAFVRRFQKIDVLEPTKEHTVKIMMGSLPKLEHKTGAKLKYTPFIQEKIMTFIVDLTTEYRRVYELSARYPDVALTILQQAFSYAVFDNKKEVSIRDVRKAIANTKLVYSDVIKKELIRFNEVFSDIYLMETPQRLKGETSI